MGRPRISEAEETKERERLTSLAREIYLQEGIEALSFRRLAEDAGVSHMYPYRFFNNKEALVVSVRVACARHFVDFVISADQPTVVPIERLLKLAGAMLKFALQHRSEYELIFTVAQAKPDQYPELLEVREKLLALVILIAEEGVQSGEIEGDAQLLAQMTWAAQHGLISLHFANQLVHGNSLEELYEPTLRRLLEA